MNGNLIRRIGVLEARVRPVEATPEAKTDYVALRESLRGHVERSEQPKPSGVAGIWHYREEITRTRLQAEETHNPATDNPLHTDFRAIRIFAAKKACGRKHGETRHDLRRCELEVLAAESFDAVRLASWNAEHDRFAGIPWQWRSADLTDDAMAVIETALAREKSGAFQQ
ncbi:MAG: hypothetical protein JNM61_08740 [Zoogloeaceae bacterium]|nr:hypothetical protein [Zoogloeaceae bacterium]